jgi:hypothetical protein
VNERGEARRLAQRAIGDAFQRVAHAHADGNRNQHAGDDDCERRQSVWAPASAVMTENETIAPIITTSPCAKLMSWMMP